MVPVPVPLVEAGLVTDGTPESVSLPDTGAVLAVLVVLDDGPSKLCSLYGRK